MSKEILEATRQFAESYAKRTNTFFCSDRAVTAYVLEGLAKNKKELGAPLCPCRYYDDKEEEVAASFWNCPCLPMRERKECHCMLFLTSDNSYTSKSQELSFEELENLLKC
jgi:ferredoxin-thioredoxin reductase catalytic chain|uniref:ferredoxin thioreductase subunit beta n=1 Tax=Chattonella marina TaxID=90936 RepID=UPI0021142B45|nr:ferredoxin thioreductase subunit beta [Chattonella marina]UTE94848.1 ferredoxin thioreductase subunit beta [Chattonella marina]